jgi:acetoin utilization deacetylase AcuC-like enzyme
MKRIPVFFSSKVVARIESFSPSAHKPAYVVRSWVDKFPIDVRAPQPLVEDDFLLAHDMKYVFDVLRLKAKNGFGGKEPEIVASLPFTNGSIVDAAFEAIRNGLVAVTPSAGFHHAGYFDGGAFCTFNGLIIAARKAIAAGIVEKVGILDCDQHYGDGTEEILEERKLRERIRHVTAGKHYEREARTFLSKLPAMVESFADCGLLIYQAGADPHVDDPLGGYLDTEQLRERDRIVFGLCRDLSLPVAWNTAGGYQTPLSKVLAIHDNTMAECVERFCVEQPVDAAALV